VIRLCLLTRHGIGVVRNLTVDVRLVDEAAATVDVYWLVEDGGLTLLLAHLVSKHHNFRKNNAKLRLFSVAPSEEAKASEKERLKVLLGEFRIQARVIIIVLDENVPPRPATLSKFCRMSGMSESDVLHDKRCMYFMKLSEKMDEMSSLASLVVASLPVPRTGIPPKKYMSYLDTIIGTRPTILVRGNQDTVLTRNS
jgi:solute carrier family 12 (sodium/potassium/chloride transporter), member 2